MRSQDFKSAQSVKELCSNASWLEEYHLHLWNEEAFKYCLSNFNPERTNWIWLSRKFLILTPLSNFWKLLNRNLTSFDNKSLNNFAFYIKYTRKLIRDHDDCSSICVLIWHFHKKMIFRFLPPSIPNAAVLQIETFCSIQTYLFITLKSGNFSTLHPALTRSKGCLEK